MANGRLMDEKMRDACLYRFLKVKTFLHHIILELWSPLLNCKVFQRFQSLTQMLGQFWIEGMVRCTTCDQVAGSGCCRPLQWVVVLCLNQHTYIMSLHEPTRRKCLYTSTETFGLGGLEPFHSPAWPFGTLLTAFTQNILYAYNSCIVLLLDVMCVRSDSKEKSGMALTTQEVCRISGKFHAMIRPCMSIIVAGSSMSPKVGRWKNFSSRCSSCSNCTFDLNLVWRPTSPSCSTSHSVQSG